MGYSYRNNGQIKDFWPDDTDTTIYLRDATLEEILDKVKEKWGDVPFDQIQILSEYVHTSCLTYDRYDPGDYTNFTVIQNLEVRNDHE